MSNGATQLSDSSLSSLPRDLLEDLREHLDRPALDFDGPFEIVKGAGENVIATFALSGAPPELGGPLVLRLNPPERGDEGVRFEAAAHAALREQGYPAPAVRLARPQRGPVGGAYLVLERVPGRALLHEINHLDRVFATPGSALRSLPRMLAVAALRVPGELAHWMLRLHGLDAARLREEIERRGVATRPFGLDARLLDMEQRARDAGALGLLPGLAWLCSNRPPEREPVLCHTDLHFLNLMVERGRVRGVLDWSSAHVSFADPWFDVGNTRAILGLRIPGLPRALRPVIEAAQRRLRSRFCRLYARSRPVDPDALRWTEAYRYLRELVGCAHLFAEPPDERPGFTEIPWILPEVRDFVLERIERSTGVRVSVPEPA